MNVMQEKKKADHAAGTSIVKGRHGASTVLGEALRLHLDIL